MEFTTIQFVIAVIAVIVVETLISVIHIHHFKQKYTKLRDKESREVSLQQRRYQMLIDNSEEMLYELSLKGETCISSDKIREKFGWEIPRQVNSLSIKSLSAILHVHPDDEDLFYSSTENLVAERTNSDITIRLGRIDGIYIWCRVIYLPVVDDENNLVSIVGKIVDVDQEVREKMELKLQSRTDGLTGLLNKNTFESDTKEYIQENTAVSSAFVFIDLDFFKNVNDKLGHIMGDQVIKDTALKLQVIFANCDLVSRFGGDEFCIFVKDIPSETLEDKLRFAVDKLTDIYSAHGNRVKLTASIGTAYCANPTITYDQLLEVADQALYKAKQNGRNQYSIVYV